MKNNQHPIVNADTPGGQRVGEAIVEVVENQLRENDPPETRATLARLLVIGESRENAIRLIANVVLFEMSVMLRTRTFFDEKRYSDNLRRLPRLPED